jgi:hypothetical protein
MSATTRHRGRWTQDDRCRSPWHYLPVEVPPGSAGLRVDFDYDRSGAILDLGCFGPAGFRGWSGGARSSFVITPGEATPGYLPGELEPGLWHVAIGLYRLPPDGAGYSVTATVSGTPVAGVPRPPRPGAARERPPRRELPARPGHRWLAGDLHTHTVPPTAELTVAERPGSRPLRARLPRRDRPQHDEPSGELKDAAARYGIILIPGQEVTTEDGTPARSATSAGSTSASLPTGGWKPPSGRAGCCR